MSVALGSVNTAAHPPRSTFASPSTIPSTIPRKTLAVSSLGVMPTTTMSTLSLGLTPSHMAFPADVLTKLPSEAQDVALLPIEFLNRLKMSEGIDMLADRGRCDSRKSPRGRVSRMTVCRSPAAADKDEVRGDKRSSVAEMERVCSAGIPSS